MPKKSKKTQQALAEPQKYSNATRPLPDKVQHLAQIEAPNPTTEWLEKNAHAKAIIMSTLIPGSEPWKIAEPLEYAADIWKALEDRYAPKNDSKGNRKERADLVADWVEGRHKAVPLTGDQQAELLQETSNTTVSNGLVTAQKQVEDLIRDRDAQGKLIAEITRVDEEMKMLKAQRKKEANAAAAKVMAEHMPNRDQRFLWALLHGGKEETMNWFNGTTAATNTN